MKTLLIAIALTTLGCQQEPWQHHDAQQDQAARALVWWGTYGADWEREPPEVTWQEVGDGKCIQAAGQASCSDGYFVAGGKSFTAVWEGSYHKSALAHELYHAFLLSYYHNGDADHQGRGWDLIVPKAEAALAAEGL